MSVSLKHVHEIMEAVKSKNVDEALKYLQTVVEKKNFVPFKKYPSKGHKHGVSAGFPQKSTKMVVELLDELKANAKNIGAETDKLTISSYDLGKGRYPRYRGGGIVHKGKRTNLRVFGSAEKKEKVEAPKEEHKEQNKTEAPQTGNESAKQEKQPEAAAEKQVGEKKEDVAKENS